MTNRMCKDTFTECDCDCDFSYRNKWVVWKLMMLLQSHSVNTSIESCATRLLRWEQLQLESDKKRTVWMSPKGSFALCDCACDFSYRNKWVVQDSMEEFTLCYCDNTINSIQSVRNEAQSQIVWIGVKWLYPVINASNGTIIIMDVLVSVYTER